MMKVGTRIIRKTATWLIKNTAAHRNHASAIISAPPLRQKGIIIGCSSHLRRRASPIPIRCFSSLSEQGQGYHLHKVNLEIPSKFPFKIEDKQGSQTIKLTREYNCTYIEVIVHVPHHSSTVDDIKKEENSCEETDDYQNGQDKNSTVSSDSHSSIRLVVTCTNFRGTTLEYGVVAYPDDFLIDSLCIKYANAPEEENIYYRGPNYAKLDKNLQKEFKRQLKLIGIIPSTTKFLHEYMANRDMNSSEYLPNPPTTNQCTPESLLTFFFNDEGIPADPLVEQYRKRGHSLVSSEDIRKSGKNPGDFVWIPYPYHRSDKLLYVEVPSKDFYSPESDLQVEDDGQDVDDFLEGEVYKANLYRCLPRKAFGDPPVISEELDKILYPNLKHFNIALKGCEVALQPYYDEMDKIKYPDDGRDVAKMTDLELEHYQVYFM